MSTITKVVLEEVRLKIETDEGTEYLPLRAVALERWLRKIGVPEDTDHLDFDDETGELLDPSLVGRVIR